MRGIRNIMYVPHLLPCRSYYSGLIKIFGSSPGGVANKKDCRLIANKQIIHSLLHCASDADHYNSLGHPSSNFHQLKKLLWECMQTSFYGKLNLDETNSYHKGSFQMI